jgi:hypothetical protein
VKPKKKKGDVSQARSLVTKSYDSDIDVDESEEMEDGLKKDETEEMAMRRKK